MRYFRILFCIAIVLMSAIPVAAQTDRFGEVDRISLDSVEVLPGQDVAIRCMLKNDEFLSIVSVPLTYNTSVLALKSISFEGSRLGYIQTKIITPSQIGQINGHFVVAFVKMLETPIPPGDGLIFTATFAVSAAASIGSVLKIDSLVYPPGGELMMTENSTAESIRPAFTAGKVVIRGQNRLPVITTPAVIPVLEGDTVAFAVTGSDPDGSAISLACPLKPIGATFSATGGQGQFIWVPSFVGPLSADASPLKATFSVSDGTATVTRDVQLQIINRNRPPAIDAPAKLQVIAGDDLQFNIAASDPDFEVISWTMNGAPVTASFDRQNPGTFNWSPSISMLDDTMDVIFIASDPQGFADTAIVHLQVQAATLYELTLDTLSVFPGDQATQFVSLDNQLSISGFTLMLSYDPTVLTPLSVTSAGTRAAAFEQFTVTHNPNGQPGYIKIVGISSLSGPGVSPLPAGSGPVAKIVFRATSDLAYEGLAIPVRFAFTDFATQNDNTLTSPTGAKIVQADIAYTDGYIGIMDIGEIRIGDINLNGLTYEIADAIYFTNYFITPASYPFNVLQYANSDVNRDNIVATIADLVRLISILVNGGSARMDVSGSVASSVHTEETSTGIALKYESDVPVGGVLVTLECGSPLDLDMITCSTPDMTVTASQDGARIKVLVYSMAGASMPEGDHEFLTLEGVEDCSILSVDMSSDDGRTMSVSLAAGIESLPFEFLLEQNYPNPFNPETRIEFSLPTAGDVSLVVYDVLGRTVRSLGSGSYTAGRHTVTWDGRDTYGQSVASGVYFYRLDAGGTVLTRKMMLVK